MFNFLCLLILNRYIILIKVFVCLNVWVVNLILLTWKWARIQTLSSLVFWLKCAEIYKFWRFMSVTTFKDQGLLRNWICCFVCKYHVTSTALSWCQVFDRVFIFWQTCGGTKSDIEKLDNKENEIYGWFRNHLSFLVTSTDPC